MSRRQPLDIAKLVGELGRTPPFRLLEVARDHLTPHGQVLAANLLLVDYSAEMLIPYAAPHGRAPVAERVDQGLAGTAFRARAIQVERVDAGWRAFVPVSLWTQRLGVLEMVLAVEPGRQLLEELDLVSFALALTMVAGGQSTDTIELTRRTRPMSLPAEMQWELVPQLAFETPEYGIAGTVEPAYEVGGDTFDYSAQPEALTASVTDAMGHGLQAALLAKLAVAGLRNARRRPSGLLEQVNQANQALCQQFGGERFVTGQVLRLDIPAGGGGIVNAGHPLPWLIRDGRIEQVQLDPDLPMGLDPGTVYRVQPFDLEPGDRLVLLSDGVLEAKPEGGSTYGPERLGALLLASGALPPHEVARLVVQEVIAYRAAALADDATLVCLDWRGTAATAEG